MKRTLTICLFLVPLVAPAQAQQMDCALSYETYEISVPHNDLDACPDSIGLDNAYCRVSVAAETATIYAFSEETDCLLASRVFFEDEYDLTFK